MSGVDTDITLASETQSSTDSGGPDPDAPLGPGAMVGRYVVLSTLGSGGMGVVYAAYDPELDRRVALKLLQSDYSGSTSGSGGRTRLLREAQALAKLSHPNVVAIHDVGTLGDEVWIAMELVEGQALGEWLAEAPRTWREVVAVMGKAGSGLAEAHAVGLLHRDFKPDNIMIGAGADRVARVRVMDFGLARQHGGEDSRGGTDVRAPPETTTGALAVDLTHEGALIGTPAYMSPEQLGRARVGPESDQFSFCVTLWEALYGQRPFEGDSLVELAARVLQGQLRTPPSSDVPSWLRRVCIRGLAVEPGDRFESMSQLLSALGQGRSHARRRRVVLGAASVAVAGAALFGYTEYDRARQTAACEQGAEIEELWNDGERSAVFDAVAAVNVNYAESTAASLTPYLDRQAEALRGGRVDACLKHAVDQTWDASMLARATWCLDDRALELRALLGELRQADEGIVRGAVGAVASLPRVGPCLDSAVLSRLPDPPAAAKRDAAEAVQGQLAQAFALQAAGKPGEALEVARAARERADAIAWPPLIAAARRLEAANLADTGAKAEAEAAYLEAYEEASRASEWFEAARAAVELTFLVGAEQGRATEGRRWAMHAEIALSFAHDPDGSLESSRLGSLGGVEFYAGEFETARELFHRSAEITEAVEGPNSPNYGRIIANVGMADQELGDWTNARAHYDEALQVSQTALGPEHPTVAINLANLASYYRDTGQHQRAVSTYERALEIHTNALGPQHPLVGHILHNLANLHSDAEEYEDAKRRFEMAIAIWTKAHGTDHRLVATAIGNLGLLHYDLGDYDAALHNQRRALDIAERILGKEHHKVAGLLSDLAQTRLAQSKFDGARELLQRAIDIYDIRDGEQFGESQAHFNLAKAIAGTGGDEAEALAEAELARKGFSELPDGGDDVTAVEAWIESRARPVSGG